MYKNRLLGKMLIKPMNTEHPGVFEKWWRKTKCINFYNLDIISERF